MGGKKSKAPAAPNYQAIAKTQGEENRKIAEYLTQANRPVQYDALGNQLVWQQGENGQWTQHVNLGQESQESLNRYLQNQDLASNMFRESLVGFDPSKVNATTSAGTGIPQFDYASGDRVADALYRSVMDRAGVQQGREVEGMEAKLRAQGLVPGTVAYDRAMQNLMTAHGDVNTLAAQNAVLGGYQEARDMYNTALAGQDSRLRQEQQAYAQRLNSQLNELNTLGSLAGYAGTPMGTAFQGFSTATGYQPGDMLGAAQASYNAQMANYNSGKQAKGGLLGAGASLAGSWLGGK